MKKKRTPPDQDQGPHKTALKWHNIPGHDLFLYARSFHQAAKSLAASFRPDPLVDFDACPVVFMYRHALELQMKALVLGDGGNFLATKPDALSVHKTHSVSWLAQFVVQIVTALKWEKGLKSDGVENVADFKAVIEELNAVDPGSYAFRHPIGQRYSGVQEFAGKMDALVELLDSIADALAAEWDMRSGGAAIDDDWNGSGSEPTIQ